MGTDPATLIVAITGLVSALTGMVVAIASLRGGQRSARRDLQD